METVNNSPVRPMARKGQKLYSSLPRINHAATMDNFRQAVGQYNQEISKENTVIQAFNDNVKDTAHTTPADDVKKVFIQLFFKKHGSITNPREYNILVDEFSWVHGNYIPKKKIQPIKPGLSTEIFSAMIYEYNQQISELEKVRQKSHITAPAALPKLKIHPGEITSRLRNGQINLNVSAKTLYNHRCRFQDAGILTEYEYHSHRRPVDVCVNNGILVFFEAKTKKTSPPENQDVNFDRWKNLQHNNVVSRTLLKDNEKKANVNNHSTNAEVKVIKDTIKNTHLQAGPKTVPPEKITPEAKASDHLRKKIQDIWELSCELAAGIYNDYTPIPLRRWHYELKTGTLTDEETRVLFIQEFFKAASKIYLHNPTPPSAGCWYNALKLWIEGRMITFSGISFSKQKIIETVPEYYWRLAYAVRFFKKRKWEGVLYPSKYFDPAYTAPEHICFEYTKKIYEKNETARDRNREKRQKLREKAAAHGKNLRKVNQMARKYTRHQVTLPHAVSYVRQNIGKEYITHFERKVRNLIEGL